MTERSFNNIAIFCVGNYYLSDDGFGIHFFHMLKAAPLPDYIEVCEFGLMGFSLADYILPYQKLILVDALKGIGKPGEIFRFDLLKKPPVFCRSMLSAHDFGIIELLDMVKALNSENLPKQVLLFGVEAEIMDQYGTTLSPQLEKALLRMKKIVLEELGIK